MSRMIRAQDTTKAPDDQPDSARFAAHIQRRRGYREPKL